MAQLPHAATGEVTNGHLHLNVHDIATQKNFWVNQMGATPGKLASIEIMKFPGVLIFLKQADPSGGTPESVVQHIGFKVRDLNAYRTKLTAAGFKLDENPNGKQIMFLGPDGLKIELTEDTSLSVPIINHHIHFFTKDVKETQDWYAKNFGAVAGMRAKFQAADLPGVNLTFSPSEQPGLPTKGRVLDHIGFEVVDLENYCKKLQASGIKFDVPYRKIPALGISVAFLTDPWGTYIELTEGLNKI